MVRPDRPQAIAAGLPSTTAAEARAELSLGETTGHLTAAEGAALRAIIFENDPLRAFADCAASRPQQATCCGSARTTAAHQEPSHAGTDDLDAKRNTAMRLGGSHAVPSQ
jgi:hypothetical protein